VQAAVGLNTLPAQLPLAPATGEFKVYFDPPERRLEVQADGGVDSIAVYTGYLMPLAAGAFAAPALELPFFDAQGGAVARAALPGQTLQVAAGEQPAEASPAPVPAIIAAAPSQAAGEGETSTLTAWQIAAAGFLFAWLITLSLWWRRAGTRRVRRRKSATTTVNTHDHPLKQQLLAALGNARTLEQGLREWEDHYGVDDEVRAAVRAVQRLCYQPGAATAAPIAHEIVAQAIRKIRSQRKRDNTASDAWSPQAFHPAKVADRGELGIGD
jgi:hypothetical protein